MSSLLLILLGLLLPTQLGLHFWPSWSYVYGLRIDYLSPTIYLTDLLLIALLIFNFFRLTIFLRSHLRSTFFICLFILLNIIFAIHPQIALIAWFRVLLLLNLINWLTNQQINRLTYLLLGLSASLIIVTILALLQFSAQSSLNGFTYWLGERRFDITTPGIARLNIFNHLILRPYATFGHPNTLGGFSLIVFILLYFLPKKNILTYFALPFAILAVILSFSKAVIGAFILVSIFILLRLKPKIILITSLILALVFSLLPVVSTNPFFGRSLPDRNFLLADSLKIISNSPLVGAGLNNFIPTQGHLGLGLQGSFIYLQPVHNVFLLLLSEIGLLGILLCLVLLYNLKSATTKWAVPLGYKIYYLKSFALILSAILLTSALDHYWLTLQQPRLLIAIVLGLLLHPQINKMFKIN